MKFCSFERSSNQHIKKQCSRVGQAKSTLSNKHPDIVFYANPLLFTFPFTPREAMPPVRIPSHKNTGYLNLCVLVCVGDAGSHEQWWTSVCSEDAEKRCHTPRRRCGVHHDREASVGSGLQSPIPHTPVLLFSDYCECQKRVSNSGPTTAQSCRDSPCTNASFWIDLSVFMRWNTKLMLEWSDNSFTER